MKTLSDILAADTRRQAVHEGCAQLIEEHIAHRQGLKGIAYRTGWAILKTAKPGILDRAVNRLLPEFLHALEPLYQEYRAQPVGSFAQFIKQHRTRATDAVLGVADHRSQEASETVQKTYARFRSGAEEEVKALVPGLGQLIEQHLA